MSKIEIVAIKRSSQTTEPGPVQSDSQPSKAERTTKKRSLPDPSSTKAAKGKAKQDGKKQIQQPTPSPQQSIMVVAGHLTLRDEKLYLRCSDGTELPVRDINSKLALWLMSHPAQMFAAEPVDWLVYPKSDYKDGRLTIALKSRNLPDRESLFPIDTGIVRGKLLATEDGRMTIGIRRNLSSAAYREMQQKHLLGDEFQQFVVHVWGQLPADAGAIVELKVKREGDRLIVDAAP